jgi:vacuolar-type H+-ATPase subunit I/STV1
MRAFEAQKQQRVKEKAKRADADKEVLSKEWDKEIKKAEKRLAELEETIAQLEANLAQWHAELEVPEKVAQLSEQAGFFEEYDRTKAELNNWMAQWDDASAALLQLESAKAAEWHGQQS